MLSTRDVILSSGTIHSIWKLGILDDAMTPGKVLPAANVAEIAYEILRTTRSIHLRNYNNSPLCGHNLVLQEDKRRPVELSGKWIQRISLKFQTEAPPEIENQPSIPDRTIEIDDEIIRLWQAEDNLESLVAPARRQGPKLQLDRQIIYPSQRLPLLVLLDQSHGEIDDDSLIHLNSSSVQSMIGIEFQQREGDKLIGHLKMKMPGN
jgi:hypothetical protein